MSKNVGIKNRDTIAKLRAIQREILAQPRFYDQSSIPEFHDCNSPCCLAGWCVWLDTATIREYKSVIEREGSLGAMQRILGITPNQAARLFVSAGGWPRTFAKAYTQATTPRQRAAVAVDRINHFIATGR